MIAIQKLKIERKRLKTGAIITWGILVYVVNRTNSMKLKPLGPLNHVGSLTLLFAVTLASVCWYSMTNIDEKIFMVIHNNCSKYKRICSFTSEAFLIIQDNKVNFANDVWRGLKPMQQDKKPASDE